MSEFEELVENILKQKPELTRQDVEDRIKQKKEKIGTGYLTDHGALFLIFSGSLRASIFRTEILPLVG